MPTLQRRLRHREGGTQEVTRLRIEGREPAHDRSPGTTLRLIYLVWAHGLAPWQGLKRLLNERPTYGTDAAAVHVFLAPCPTSKAWLPVAQDVAKAVLHHRPLGPWGLCGSTPQGPDAPRTGLGFKRRLLPRCRVTVSTRCHLFRPRLSSSVRWASSAHCPGVVGGDQPEVGAMVLGGSSPKRRGPSSSPVAVVRSDLGREDRLGGRSSDGPLTVHRGKAVPGAMERQARRWGLARGTPQTCQHPCSLLLTLHACLAPALVEGNRLVAGGWRGEGGVGLLGATVMRDQSYIVATPEADGQMGRGLRSCKTQTFSSRGGGQVIRQEPGGQGKPGPRPVVVPGEEGSPISTYLTPPAQDAPSGPRASAGQVSVALWVPAPGCPWGGGPVVCPFHRGERKPREQGRQAGGHIGGDGGARDRRAPLSPGCVCP